MALGSQSLVEFQAGEALNDITGVAFILAAAAILVNGYAARGRGGGAVGAAPATPRNVKRFASNIPGTVAGPDPDTPAAGRDESPSSISAALAVAGIAAGLAAGIKLSFLAPSPR